jgi:hypothetical protein
MDEVVNKIHYVQNLFLYAYRLGQSLLVSLPALLPVLLGFVPDILLSLDFVDSPSNDNHITLAILDDLGRSPVLLSHRIPFTLQSNSRGKNKEVLVFVTQSSHRDETDNKVSVVSCHLDGSVGVLTGREVTGGRHLGEEEKTSSKRLANGCETGYDAWTGKRVGVGDVGPGRNLVNSGRVLQGHSVSCDVSYEVQ